MDFGGNCSDLTPYGEADGNTTLSGTLTIDPLSEFTTGTNGLYLALNASSTGTSTNWWLKFWTSNPAIPLLVLNEGNTSYSLPVLIGEALNVEFYHKAGLGIRTLTITGELVPEPTTAVLVGLGIILLKSKGNSDRSFSKCSLFRH
jgi:hypothetical protein